MEHIRLAKKIKETLPDEWKKHYRNLVLKKIRAKYSTDEEFAILRQRDSKPEEFKEYFEYVEHCKVEAREELGGNE